MINQSILTISHFTALITTKNISNDTEVINGCGEYIIKNLNLHIVNKIHHAFLPQGKTIVYILSESHLAIHTWPEKNTIHVDLISCKNTTESLAKKTFIEAFSRFIVTDCLFKKHDF